MELIYEADRLRRIAETDRLDFAVFDSVAWACHVAPEAAEAATLYYQAVRRIGMGSLHIAHINRSETGDQRPFGSTFWHNGARAIWFTKITEDLPDSHTRTVGLFPRKRNTGPLGKALAFEFQFQPDRTQVKRVDVADVADLAPRLSLSQRMAHLLRGGALTIAAIAEELDEKVDSVTKAAKRGDGKLFIRVPGKDGVYRIGLVDRRTVA
jgi:hypothetical protein